MENLKLTQFMKNPDGMYIKITKEELDKFFSTGYAKLSKERCTKNYTMFDYKQGILEANYLVKNDATRHTVDLMMFALGKIENLEKTVKDFEKKVMQESKEEKIKEKQNFSPIQDKREV